MFNPRFDTAEERGAAFLKHPEDLGIAVFVDGADAWEERYRQEHLQAGSFPFESGDQVWWDTRGDADAQPVLDRLFTLPKTQLAGS